MKRLELRDVAVRFGAVQALAGVTVGVDAGEILMLAGPNGAGKSTLLKVLLGLVRPDKGELFVDNKLARVDRHFKHSVSYLPEAVAFPDNLSGRQVLRFFAAARGVEKRRVDVVLEEVGLKAAMKRAVRGYSRGMRQRLGLALALLPEADVLILDEPTGGLDQEGLSVLWEVLARTREAGRLVLLSSHDLSLLERRVDRICILRQGKVVACAAPGDLRQLVSMPINVRFGLSDDAEQRAALTAALEGWAHTRQMHQHLDELEVEIEPQALLPLMDLRGDFPGAVNAIRVKEPGLDAVYERLLEESASDTASNDTGAQGESWVA